jgi:hypothetical protein
MRQSLVFALAVAGALVTSTVVRAENLVLPTASDDPVHQCHNPHLGSTGGYQIDWDFLGFDQDSGNPHGTLHISGETNIKIDMSNQSFVSTFTDPPRGNTVQSSFIFSSSGEGATFNYDDIVGITLESVNPVSLRGTQVDPLLQLFTLTITTTTATYIFDLESIMGSQVNFNSRAHDDPTAANLRFCGGLRTENPPVIPEPTTLFGVGLAALSAIRARRKLVG